MRPHTWEVEDMVTWKCFLHYWHFVRGIHKSSSGCCYWILDKRIYHSSSHLLIEVSIKINGCPWAFWWWSWHIPVWLISSIPWLSYDLIPYIAKPSVVLIKKEIVHEPVGLVGTIWENNFQDNFQLVICPWSQEMHDSSTAMAACSLWLPYW